MRSGLRMNISPRSRGSCHLPLELKKVTVCAVHGLDGAFPKLVRDIQDDLQTRSISRLLPAMDRQARAIRAIRAQCYAGPCGAALLLHYRLLTHREE
jgi:hypothetical protein